MSTFEEKLSILSEMIAFARVDHSVKTEEYNFLLKVANQLGVDKPTFDSLFDKTAMPVFLKSEAERILQFHRLVLLMNVDRTDTSLEVALLHNIGLGMGLPPSAIEQVLTIMHKYPDKIIPPEILINIFKIHYN
ncbi:TerB family tellurite resistance protein [Flavobacteriaceae bacterium KMM 6897]|nr:TerB family tellurite resistance protein [Flavobacteriaceae bacterium KMM 6897]MEB8344646.1 TerB family tellurite resistance protein [Flavobacteriaceae bacterium KMM 6898]